MMLHFESYQVIAAETAGPANTSVEDLVPSLEDMGVEIPDESQKQKIEQTLKICRSLLRLSYGVMGLGNEGGECLGKMKKLIRDHGGIMSDEFRNQMIHEIGDTLWYVADVCTCLGVSMGEVAQANLDKLRDRKERGVLQGDGDQR